MLSNERGMVYTPLLIAMLPLVLLILFMLADAERINLVRGQEATMADAASLAAADTATPVTVTTYQYSYDSNGNITGIVGTIASTQAVIEDPVAAESAARQAALLNMGVLANQDNAGLMGITINPTPGANDDLAFQVIGTDSCVTKIVSTVKTFAVNALEKLYGQPGSDKDEGFTSYGQAVIAN